MPSPSLNQTPYQATEPNKPFLKGKKRKFILLFTMLVVAGFLAYATTKRQNITQGIQNIFNNPQETSTDIVNKDTGELNESTINDISNLTVEKVREASESNGVNAYNAPNLSETETQNKILEQVGNTEPQNYDVSYSDYGLSLPSLEVKQGDMVTWTNASSSPMKVMGEGWQSASDREPGERFTYTFYFLGENKYKINDTVEGVIVVVK